METDRVVYASNRLMLKTFPIMIALFAVFTVCLSAQSERVSDKEPVRVAESQIKKKRVNLYNHLGSVEIPATFTGNVTANWNDAWAGFLRSEDGSFKIGWRAGTIVYVRESRKDEIESIGTELHGGNVYDVAVLTDKAGKTITAKIGWLEFSSVIDTDEKEELFWSVLATFQKERCTECRLLPIRVDN